MNQAKVGKQDLRQLIAEGRLHAVYPPPTVDQIFRHVAKSEQDSKLAAVSTIRIACEEFPELLRMVEPWDRATVADRKKLKLETLRIKAGITMREFLAKVLPIAHETYLNMTKLQIVMALPSAVQKSVEYAMRPDGFRDRQMILQSGGVAPSPKGINVNVQQNNAHAASADIPHGLKSFEDQIIEMAEVIRD